MKIKPCPSCGKGADTLYTTGTFACGYRAYCRGSKCGMEGPIKKTVEEAIDAWNDLPRRGDVEEIADLKGALHTLDQALDERDKRLKLAETVCTSLNEILCTEDTCELREPTEHCIECGEHKDFHMDGQCFMSEVCDALYNWVKANEERELKLKFLGGG